MKNQNDLIIPNQTLELCQLRPESPLSLCAGKNTLVVIPEHMTAIQAVNTLGVLTEFVSDLIIAIKAACGTCEERKKEDDGHCPFGDICDPDECPYADVDGPEVILSDSARREMGIPLDAKLELLPDEGEGLVVAADYDHDITDVPEYVRKGLAMAWVCPGKLDELLMNEAEVWHG